MGREATPPTLAVAYEAAEAIHQRRVGTNDESLLFDPSDLLKCVRWTQSHRSTNAATRALDHTDVLTIVAALAAEMDRLQLAEMRAARKRGPSRRTWEEIGAALGLNGRTSAESRYQRLRAGAAGEIRDEATMRALDRHEADDTAAGAKLKEPIRRAVEALVQAGNDLPEDCRDIVLTVRYLLDRPTEGPRLLPATRTMLRDLAGREPAGTAALLADLADQVRSA